MKARLSIVLMNFLPGCPAQLSRFEHPGATLAKFNVQING
jgi:hypothetical protein